jgi:arsenate reductase
MKKIYHLSTCNTCQRIIQSLNNGAEFELQDIKTTAITEAQLEDMYNMAGSYEVLFSRRAMKYRSLGLNEQQLSEADYKKWILAEYTFLKRPVIIIDDSIFIGNAKKTVAAAQEKAAL